MARIIIKYKVEWTDKETQKQSFENLATEVCEGLEEVVVPFDPETDEFEADLPVYITRKFKRYDARTWRVVKVATVKEDDALRCDVILHFLDPGLRVESLAERSHSNTEARNKLRFGTLVECDFGYFSQVVTLSEEFGPATDYYTLTIPHEMVKRRLCIVVSHQLDPAIVLPISTRKESVHRTTSFEINSLPKDLLNYSADKESFVKAHSITSVSSNRIFPLKLLQKGKVKIDSRFSRYIKDDETLNQIRKISLNAVSCKGVIQDKDKAIEELENIKTELDTQLALNNQNEDELSRLKEEVKELNAKNLELIEENKAVWNEFCEDDAKKT